MVQVSESDYRTAQEGDARIKQEFLDEVNLEDAKEFVFKVLYYDNRLPSYTIVGDKKFESDVLMTSILPEITLFGIKFPFSRKSAIGVFKDSFNLSFPSFLGVLIDHEGQHARVNYKRPLAHTTLDFHIRRAKSSEEKEYFQALSELPAYANELANAQKRGLSLEETAFADKYLSLYLKKVTDNSVYFKRPRSPCRDIKSHLCDSPGDDLLRELLNV